MKKYKTVLWSVGLYIVAFLLVISSMFFSKLPPVGIAEVNPWLSGIALILVLFGVFSAFRSTRAKEAVSVGYIMVLLGFVFLYFLLPVIANFFLAFTPV